MSKLRDQFDQGNVSKLSGRDFIRKATDRKYYGYTFDQAGRHPISLAIDFMTKDGNRFGVYYMEVQSPIQLHLGSGNSSQRISLRTSSQEIIVEGKKLTPVYEYILEQRLVWVKEISSSFSESTDSTIESISVSDF